jgi:hypothetical protein
MERITGVLAAIHACDALAHDQRMQAVYTETTNRSRQESDMEALTALMPALDLFLNAL